MGMGYAGARGGGSAPGYARTPPSVAGSPALSSLDRCALLRPQRSCRSALLAVPALCSTCGVISYPFYHALSRRCSQGVRAGRGGPRRAQPQPLLGGRRAGGARAAAAAARARGLRGQPQARRRAGGAGALGRGAGWPADALVQAGFGQQLLSMRLGEGGLGLSLGARLPALAIP